MKISQLAIALCCAAALTPSAAKRINERRAETTDPVEVDHRGSRGRSDREPGTCSVNVGDTLYTSAVWVFGIGDGGLNYDPTRKLQEDGTATIAPIEDTTADATADATVTEDNAYAEEIGTVWFPVFKFVNEDAVNTCVYRKNLFGYGCGYGCGYGRRCRNLSEERELGFGAGFCAVPEDYIGGYRRYERKLSSYDPEELQLLQDKSKRELMSPSLDFDDLPCGMELVGFMTADAAIFGVQIEGPARRKLDNGYYDIPIPAASIDLNFICVDDGDIECALGRGRCGRRGVSNVIKGSITASGLGALFAPELFGEGDEESRNTVDEYLDYEPYGMGQFGITGGTNIFNNIQGGQINMDYVAPNTMRFEITAPTTTDSD